MFPARAGMSPATGQMWPWKCSVPRVSGDEPIVHNIIALIRMCSLRKRG